MGRFDLEDLPIRAQDLDPVLRIPVFLRERNDVTWALNFVEKHVKHVALGGPPEFGLDDDEITWFHVYSSPGTQPVKTQSMKLLLLLRPTKIG